MSRSQRPPAAGTGRYGLGITLPVSDAMMRRSPSAIAAPRVDGADQDRDADHATARPDPEGDRRDQEDELERPEQAGEQQVADPAVRARIDQLPPQAIASQVKSTGRRARASVRQAAPHGTMPAVAAAAYSSSWPRQGPSCSPWRPRARSRSTQRGTLTLSQRVDLSKGGYVEGSMSYLNVRRGDRVVLRARRARVRSHVRLHPRAGLYRVVSFQRPCDGNCSRPRPAHRPLLASACTSTPARASGFAPSRGPGRGCTIRVARAARRSRPPGACGRRGATCAGGRFRLVRPDRHPRPPARLRPPPALRDRERRQGDAARRAPAPARRPHCRAPPTAPCSTR